MLLQAGAIRPALNRPEQLPRAAARWVPRCVLALTAVFVVWTRLARQSQALGRELPLQFSVPTRR